MPKSNVASLLKANKVEKPSKGSKVPTEQADALYDTVYHAHMAYKNAESAFRQVEDELLTRTNALYEQAARDGDFSKSMNCPGIETAGVQVSYKDQFSAIPDEHEDTLKGIMGDNYSVYFEEKRSITLSDTSDETVDLLIKKLGKDVFLRLFEIKLTITPKKDMDRRQFELDDQARVFLKQYKASVKLGK